MDVGEKMKKGNVIALAVIVLAALTTVAIYTTMKFNSQSADMFTIDDASTEVTLVLEDAVTKGVLDFLEYGFSIYETDGLEGTPGWYCTDPMPPGSDESVSALKKHVMKHVEQAILKFNGEYDDLKVSGPSEIDMGSISQISDLPDDTFSLVLKDIEVTLIGPEDTVKKMVDLPYSKSYKIWNIYKGLHTWMEGDAGELSQNMYDLIDAKECKARLCSCGATTLDTHEDDFKVTREEVFEVIDASIADLNSKMDGITCTYTTIHEVIENNAEYDSKLLSPFGGKFVIKDGNVGGQDAKCAVGPFQGPCTNDADDTELPDDLSNDPTYGMVDIGIMDIPETSPDLSRLNGNYGCPTEAGAPNLVARDRLYEATMKLTKHYPSTADPAVPRVVLSGPRIDRLGMHRTISVLFSVNCKSPGEFFQTAEGEKPLSSNVLVSISLHRECPPPGNALTSLEMCMIGECEIGGAAVAAGAEWWAIFGEPCKDDSECIGAISGENCFYCGENFEYDDYNTKTGEKSCMMRSELIPQGQCQICQEGQIVPMPEDVEYSCGDGGCGMCVGESCEADPGQNNQKCGQHGCKICADGSCVADTGLVNQQCPSNVCKKCDASGKCSIAGNDGASCGSSTCYDATCSGGNCDKVAKAGGTSCGSEKLCDGSTVNKVCVGTACKYTGTKPTCCGSSICTPGSQKCCENVCVSSGTDCGVQTS